MKYKKTVFSMIGIFLLIQLVAVNIGTPPPTPVVSSEAATSLASRFFQIMAEKNTDSLQKFVWNGQAVGNRIVFLYKRRYWLQGVGASSAEAINNLFIQAKKLKQYLRKQNKARSVKKKKNKPKKVELLYKNALYMTFCGENKSIFLPQSFLWNFSLIPGIDGISMQRKDGEVFMLPEETLDYKYAGGYPFSFLPLRFGLKRNAIVNLLSISQTQTGSGWGIGARLRQVSNSRKTGSLSRFRSISFFAIKERNQSIIVDRLFRLSKSFYSGVRKKDIYSSAVTAGDWFIRHLDAHGRFSYRYYPYSNRKNPNQYSMPRHAGSMLILYRIYGLTKDPRYLKAGDLALTFLKKRIQPAPKGKLIFENGYIVKLGTIAISCLSLFERRRITGDTTKDELLKQLLAFIGWMQKKDGSFCHFYLKFKGKNKKIVGQNFSGQALWVMAKAGKVFGTYKKDFIKGMDFQVGKGWNFFLSEYYIFPFSWEMQAIREAAGFIQKPQYERFLFQAADSMIESQYEKDRPFFDFKGGFGTPEWFTPLAHAAGFQGEGLTAAYSYSVLTKNKKKSLKYKKSLMLAAAFLLGQQVVKETAYFYPRPELAIGAFRAGPADHSQQIDYTQHCLAALLNMLDEGVFDGSKKNK